MNLTRHCDKCDSYFDKDYETVSVIYVATEKIWVCDLCLDKHFPLV